MLLKARNAWWKELLRRFPSEQNTVIQSAIRHGNETRFSEIDSDSLTPDELEELKDIASRFTVPSARTIVWKIDTIRELYAAPKGNVIKKLEALTDAIRAYVGPSARRWVYIEGEDETVKPYFVKSVQYHRKQIITHDDRGSKWKEVIPAYVTMDVTALKRGSTTSRTFTWHIESLRGGITIPQLFARSQTYLETPWAAKKYDAEMERYHEIISQLGAQYAAIGYGSMVISKDRYYGSTSSLISMVREGYSTKVVIDDNEEDASDKKSSSSSRSRDDSTSNSFWANYDLAAMGKRVGAANEDEDEEEDDSEEEDAEADTPTAEQLAAVQKTTPPVHPYVRAFDLDKHDYVIIHSSYLEDYPWDATLFDKLVLPDATKDMIQILVSGTDDAKEDIIRGKMQGVIVIATGEPGTGKTLTAEVFSEVIKRPLYVIQCAQLGTNAAEIEGRLKEILRRAQRWQAILLIDEADVYIRARGDDIEQNAIVGVFLRVLEYYRGVLFMTSNRATVIDDAIMSRASSWIRYAMPTPTELRKLWQVLGKQYDVELTEGDIDSLTEHLPKLSGRCVRNLLKLARHLSKARGEQVTEKMIRGVAQFQYLPHQTDEELREAAA